MKRDERDHAAVTKLVQLWHGDLALGRAFWEYTIVYGTLANLLATAAAFAAIVADGPVLLAVVLFLLPLPYNFTAALGVWRSAARYAGPAAHANLARIAAVAWAIVASLA
jgi:hypothetical protein